MTATASHPDLVREILTESDFLEREGAVTSEDGASEVLSLSELAARAIAHEQQHLADKLVAAIEALEALEAA